MLLVDLRNESESLYKENSRCPRQEDPTHKNFFKVQYIIIQAILGRKSMKKFAVTNEKIFHVYKAFDPKK